jgi:hypothetical protein
MKVKRIDVLEAFASSKPTEFDAFALRYEQQHQVIQKAPVSPTDTEAVIKSPEETPETSTLIVDETPKVKKKSKRVKKVEDTL